MTRRFLVTCFLVAGLALLGACADITPPARTPAYAFDAGGDVFRWPADHLPVRYYADPRGAMPVLVRDGLRAWERQFLYGEFRTTLVSDSALADVIVRWADSVPPDVPPDTAGAAGACGGVTSFIVEPSDTITGPLRVHLSVGLGYTPAQVASCARRVAAHELGHTLGLLVHSPVAGDLMYAAPAVEQPSDRDRVTVEVLYHTPPNIFPPRR